MMSSHAPKQFAPRFWLLWGGQAASLAGSFAVQFAIIWWLTAETGSATMLATATLIGLLPQVALGPFFGALVDRWNRKQIMFWSDTVIGLASAWLAWQFAAGTASVADVFIVLGIRGIGGAFHLPAMTASTSLMVPKDHYTRIQGLNQALQGGAPLIAAPVGAFLVNTFSMQVVMLVDVATAIAALVPLLLTRVPQPTKESSSDATVLASTGEGLRYVTGHRQILHLVLGAALVNFCILPAFALLPLFVLQELHQGAWYLSWLQLTFGIGGIVGGLILAAWGGFTRQVYTVLLGFIVLGLATFCLGLAPRSMLFLPFIAILLVAGGAALINGTLTAMLQAVVPPDMQGRVFTLLASIAGAITPVALLIAAPVAEWFGLRFWYLVGGAICCIGAAAVMFLLAFRYNAVAASAKQQTEVADARRDINT